MDYNPRFDEHGVAWCSHCGCTQYQRGKCLLTNEWPSVCICEPWAREMAKIVRECIDTTADGQLVPYCEHFHCPKCGRECHIAVDIAYCDSCRNHDDGGCGETITDKLRIAIEAARHSLKRRDSCLFGVKDRKRWMPAVLIRKADLRELVKALKERGSHDFVSAKLHSR